jgi:hypothetical protein
MGISYSDYILRLERQEGLYLPWVTEPLFQFVPCLPRTMIRLIGSMNPSQDGGLVGRQFLLLLRQRRDANVEGIGKGFGELVSWY